MRVTAPLAAAVDTSNLRAYDTVFVPALFGPWAERLVEVLAPPAGCRALDAGTGSGVVARLLAARVGPAGVVVGVDVSLEMLALAVNKPAAAGHGAIEYRLRDAADIDAADGEFGAVAAQQVLQFVPDLSGTLAELRRVASDGARLAASVWAGLDQNPMFAALHAGVRDVFGSAAASVFVRPWSLPGDRLAVAAREAGWGDVDVTRHELTVAFAGVDRLLGLYMFSAAGDLVRTLDAAGHAELREAVVRGLIPHTAPTGAVTAPTTAIMLTARNVSPRTT